MNSPAAGSKNLLKNCQQRPVDQKNAVPELARPDLS
jgi:hypothetical protein